MEEIEIVACDSHPLTKTCRELDRQYPGRLLPVYEPVDFTQADGSKARIALLDVG